MKKTICVLVTALTLLNIGCSSSDRGRELGKEVAVPNECNKILNFGYNGTVDKYFVTCQKNNEQFSFYSRLPKTNNWDEMNFLLQNENIPQGSQIIPEECNKIYNLGYNYASSRFFISCKKQNNEFSFYSKEPKEEDWKEIQFKASNGKILGGW